MSLSFQYHKHICTQFHPTQLKTSLSLSLSLQWLFIALNPPSRFHSQFVFLLLLPPPPQSLPSPFRAKSRRFRRSISKSLSFSLLFNPFECFPSNSLCFCLFLFHFCYCQLRFYCKSPIPRPPFRRNLQAICRLFSQTTKKRNFSL
jgi:hypothetical protein